MNMLVNSGYPTWNGGYTNKLYWIFGFYRVKSLIGSDAAN